MKIRWQFIYLFLILIGLLELKCFGITSTPLLPHNDPANEREFQNVYQKVSQAPAIFIGAGAPGFAPSKIGDIFVSTTTSKIYIATAAVNSASWDIVN